jgi:hypothetical protein
MPANDSLIKKEWFYHNDSEKTKLNWFLYEVALEYQVFIKRSQSLEGYRKKHSEKNIARFCTYYAKRMKKSVLEQLAGLTDATILDEEYIADFYPKNTSRQNALLMQVAFDAWDSLLAVCENCPSRCLSEKDRLSDFFDFYEE